MATTTQQQISQRIPGEKSSNPGVALVLGWLIPGAGHMFIGKWIRGGLILVSVLGMFLIGIGLQGQIYQPSTGEILDILGFVGQLGLGALDLIAHMFSLGAASVFVTSADWGSKFIVVAGLLNLIAAVDAHSLANGRKAS